MKRQLALLVFFWLPCGVGWASNIYSVSYEGNHLPEQEPGWHRYTGAGGAIRTIETDPDDPNNHFLVINSLANHQIFDYAQYNRQMDPNGPSERFYAEWRVLITEAHGEPDQGIGFAADNNNIVAFHYSYDYIEAFDGSNGWSAPIAPGVFHTYRLESADMVSYALWIDGQIARNGPFFEGLAHSFAAFGDDTQGGGARSVGKWDFVRFGVTEVPEPNALALIVGLCVCGGRRRR